MYKLILFILLLTASISYSQESKSPEATVSSFYKLIKQQDDNSISQAYKLLSKEHTIYDENVFKHIVMSYDKDMIVEIIDVMLKKNYAIVKIKCIVPSSFGGTMEIPSDIHLLRQDKTKAWEIKLNSETSEEL